LHTLISCWNPIEKFQEASSESEANLALDFSNQYSGEAEVTSALGWEDFI